LLSELRHPCRRLAFSPPSHYTLSLRVPPISSAAYFPYPCCCCIKTSDFAGGPDHLSFFAPSDSYRISITALICFHFPVGLDATSSLYRSSLVPSCFGYCKVHLPFSIAVSSFHRLCPCVNFCLLITFPKVSLMSSVPFLIILSLRAAAPRSLCPCVCTIIRPSNRSEEILTTAHPRWRVHLLRVDTRLPILEDIDQPPGSIGHNFRHPRRRDPPIRVDYEWTRT